MQYPVILLWKSPLKQCPVGWAKTMVCLPGYSERGKQYAGDWDADKNPAKGPTKTWLDFLKSDKYFPGGGGRRGVGARRT